jgi:arginine-tRNA-protein transferase
MSVIPLKSPVQQFYRSAPMPCPYLPGQVERKLFTRLHGADALEVNSALTRAGFRRSHDVVYRPVCPTCSACIPVRIPVARFAPNRTMRRIRKQNADLRATVLPPVATVEQYQLFIGYQRARHGAGEMARMAFADYAAMVQDGSTTTAMVEFRDDTGALAGCLLVDRVADGFSAVYSFFDAGERRPSLGTYLITALVDLAREDGLDFVYLGYWIHSSTKMAYKSRFRPVEALGRDGWAPLDLDSGEAPP